MTVTVCISDNGDDRLAQTLRSLEGQLVQPDQVLIERRGTVAASRNLMYREATGDIVAFIDTDQEAPPWWTMALSTWISLGWADFACGPTRPHPEPMQDSRYADYLAEIERRHYLLCGVDQTAFPMGNSMWSRTLLDKLAEDNGGVLFDERFTAGEDYDINLRATALGYVGLFVPHGWVYHDQSTLDNPLKIMRRKLRYCYGGALAQVKNGHVPGRLGRVVVRQGRYWHWLEGFQAVAQGVGLARAYWRWHVGKKA